MGIEADDAKVDMVVKELAGKNLEEVIAAGTAKLGSVPSGGKWGFLKVGFMDFFQIFAQPVIGEWSPFS